MTIRNEMSNPLFKKAVVEYLNMNGYEVGLLWASPSIDCTGVYVGDNDVNAVLIVTERNGEFIIEQTKYTAELLKSVA
jgi:hypothetical protein